MRQSTLTTTPDEARDNSPQASTPGGSELIDWEDLSVRSQSKYRLSIRAKLALAPLVALIPILLLSTWLFWGQPFLWATWAAGLTTLGLGLAIIWWGTRPLDVLSRIAKALAGARLSPRKALGILGTSPPWDVALSSALDEIERSLVEIQTLNRVAQFIVTDYDLETILTRIAQEAVALLRADAGIIGLWDSEKEIFHDVAASNLPIAFPDREWSASESFTSQVAKSGRVGYLDDYTKYPQRIRELDSYEFRGTLGAPLTVQGQPRGALTVLTRDPARRFTPKDGQLLATFANQAATALDKARIYRISMARLEELSQAQAELARKSRQLQRALSTVVRVQEHERSRIAADVHDGVVQLMVGSLLELQAAMAHFGQASDTVIKKYSRARELIQEAVAELRRVIFDLRPLVLETAGLVPAIETLTRHFADVAGFVPSLIVIGTPCRLSADAEVAAYRIVQELLNNVIKHAEAGSVDVTVRFGSSDLELIVADDGKGFQTAHEPSLQEGKSVGLIGIRERALSVGGQVHVSSLPGLGTEVSIALPKVNGSDGLREGEQEKAGSLSEGPGGGGEG